MPGNTKKFLADNFANIAIALSVVFLVFELTQNRRMMERELIFMEAQAYIMSIIFFMIEINLNSFACMTNFLE